MIDKLSNELEQTDQYYVNQLMTERAISDMICKPLGEPKLIMLLCSEVLIFLFDILLRLLFGDTLARLVASLLDIR